MKKLDTNIWVYETAFTLFGAEFGNRMTIVRLSGGRLLLHSPIKLDSEVVDGVRALGVVSYIVTPNNFHGLFVDEWLSEFPEAEYYTAMNSGSGNDVGLPMSILIEKTTNEKIEIVKVEGVPKVNEYAFIHTESNTLILTDMAFNIGNDISLWSKIFFKLNGALNSFGPTRLMKSMITDPDALKHSISIILEFDIDRVIVSHGSILETKAKETLRHVFDECCLSRPSRKVSRLSLSRCG
ncbi:MAG: DUF4336 domain-containing protein [Ectothiorhodospiraceae bacterium]|nr:DUF4336 domain-containing protein [Ectothiorhodospiraceae bacterium]